MDKKRKETVCPGCEKPVLQSKTSIGTPISTIFEYEDGVGLWHWDCYCKAYKEGTIKPKDKEVCPRCGNNITYDHDSFLYKKSFDGKKLYMHGACLHAQLKADIGIREPNDSLSKKYRPGFNSGVKA